MRKTIFHAIGNPKRVEWPYSSDKIDFQSKLVTRDKGHSTSIKDQFIETITMKLYTHSLSEDLDI